MESAEVKVKSSKKKTDKTVGGAKKKRTIAITTLVVGIVMLIIGVVFLVLNLTRGAAVADGEYLVAAENWVLDGSDEVVWNFTEIGKGKLTTDGHEHDYDFIWAIKDGKLLIETDWLYDLENEYEYSLNQSDGILTLTEGDTEYKFVAQ